MLVENMFTWDIYGTAAFPGQRKSRDCRLPYGIVILKKKSFYLLRYHIFIYILLMCYVFILLRSLLVLQSTRLGHFCQRLHAFWI